MKVSSLFLMVTLSIVCLDTFATTPTEKLQNVTSQLISVALDKKSSEQEKKDKLSKIIQAEIDLETISKKVILSHWDNASEAQKKYFMLQFEKIIVKNYFTLLNKYSNEKIVFGKEQVKDDKLAIVDSEIISGVTSTPVRYRMIKINGVWKVYDFAPEGVSFVSSYKNNYAITLNQSGVEGLVEVMSKQNSAK
jgi:phospholipid transport system substrate-binding protein